MQDKRGDESREVEDTKKWKNIRVYCVCYNEGGGCEDSDLKRATEFEIQCSKEGNRF